MNNNSYIKFKDMVSSDTGVWTNDDITQDAKATLMRGRATSSTMPLREAAYDESIQLYTRALPLCPAESDRAIIHRNIAIAQLERSLLEASKEGEGMGWDNARLYNVFLWVAMYSVKQAIETGKPAMGLRWIERSLITRVCDTLACVFEGALANDVEDTEKRYKRIELIATAFVPLEAHVHEYVGLQRAYFKIQYELAHISFVHVQKSIDDNQNDKSEKSERVVENDLQHLIHQSREVMAPWFDALPILQRVPLSTLVTLTSCFSEEERINLDINFDTTTLVEQIEFLLRRAQIVIFLWETMQRLECALGGNEDLSFDMKGVLQCMDDVREALRMSNGDGKKDNMITINDPDLDLHVGGGNNVVDKNTNVGDNNRSDVELACICLYELGTLHLVALHEKEKGYQLYAEAVKLANTLTVVVEEEETEDIINEAKNNDKGEVENTTNASNLNASKPKMNTTTFGMRKKWLEKAAAFVRKEDCAREEALELDENNLIWKELREIMRFYHKVPLKEFLDHIYERFPPKTGIQIAKGGMSKAVLVQALRDYNPGAQKVHFPGDEEIPLSWLKLCSEIQKLLNVEFEKLRKKKKFSFSNRKVKIIPVVMSDYESIGEPECDDEGKDEDVISSEEKGEENDVNDEEKEAADTDTRSNGISSTTGASSETENDIDNGKMEEEEEDDGEEREGERRPKEKDDEKKERGKGGEKENENEESEETREENGWSDEEKESTETGKDDERDTGKWDEAEKEDDDEEEESKSESNTQEESTEEKEIDLEKEKNDLKTYYSTQAKEAWSVGQNKDEPVSTRLAAYGEATRLTSIILSFVPLPDAKEQAYWHRNLTIAYAEGTLLLASLEGWGSYDVYSKWLMNAAYSCVRAVEHGMNTMGPMWVQKGVILFLVKCINEWAKDCERENFETHNNSNRYHRAQLLAWALDPLLCLKSAFLEKYEKFQCAWFKLQRELARGALSHAHQCVDQIHLDTLFCQDERISTLWHQASKFLLEAKAPLAALRDIAAVHADDLHDMGLIDLSPLKRDAAFLGRRVRIAMHMREAQVKWKDLCAQYRYFGAWPAGSERKIADIIGNMTRALHISEGTNSQAGEEKNKSANSARQAAAAGLEYGGGGGEDLYSRCVISHEIASVYGQIGNNDKALEMHKTTIKAAAGLTSEVINEDVGPMGELSTKGWYMRSWKIVRKKAEDEKRQAERDKARKMAQIQWDIKYITTAFYAMPMLEFLRFLYRAYPPKNNNTLSPKLTTINKRTLLLAIRDYSASHQKQYFEDGNVPQSWELLCTEIQKIMNDYYTYMYK